jgi:hypothetical protein
LLCPCCCSPRIVNLASAFTFTSRYITCHRIDLTDPVLQPCTHIRSHSALKTSPSILTHIKLSPAWLPKAAISRRHPTRRLGGQLGGSSKHRPSSHKNSPPKNPYRVCNSLRCACKTPLPARSTSAHLGQASSNPNQRPLHKIRVPTTVSLLKSRHPILHTSRTPPLHCPTGIDPAPAKPNTETMPHTAEHPLEEI